MCLWLNVEKSAHLPAEKQEVGRRAQNGHDAHHVLVDIGTGRAPGNHEDDEDVGHQEEGLGRTSDLLMKGMMKLWVYLGGVRKDQTDPHSKLQSN